MSKTAILGACTAYGIARKYGYTGTEEEWNALQNSLKNEAATYANSARSSASAALTSEQKAAASEANAKAYMDSAEESKNAAFSTTPEGYEANVQKLEDMDIQTATGESLSLVDTRTGGIKIDKIAGKSVQNQYTGKNILITKALDRTVNGVTFKLLDNGGISVIGTATAEVSFAWHSHTEPKIVNAKKGDSVIFSNTSDKCKFAMFNMPSVSSLIGGTSVGNGEKTITFNKEPNEEGWYTAFLVEPNTTINEIIYPMVRLSSITDGTWEPYVGGMPSPSPEYHQEIESVGDNGSIKITSCGKNLASDNVDDYTLGYLTDNSVQTANTASIYINDYIFVPSNVNILSIQEKNGFFTKIIFYDEDKNIIKSTDITIQTTNNTFVTKTIIMPENTKFIRYNLCAYNWDKKATKNEVLDEFIDLQFEFGASTEYEPYQSTEITIPLSEPLRSIGDVKDEIVKQDGKWGVLRRIGNVEISELPWTKDNDISGVNNFRFMAKYAAIVTPPNISTALLCNKLWVNASPIMGTKVDNTIAHYKDGNLYVNCGSVSNVTDFKALMNEAYLCYILVTSTFEPFTDQTPFYGLSSFDGVTNIITDQTIEPTIDIEYGKSQVGAYTLENNNLSKKNEAVLTDLQTAYLTTLAQEV